MNRQNHFRLARLPTTVDMQAVAPAVRAHYSSLSAEQESEMPIWVRCQAEVNVYSRGFRHFVAWTFALAILVLWVASALAASITLRVVPASPGYTPEGRPSNTVKINDEGRSTFLLSNAALSTAVESRTMTHSGIPLDEQILVRVRGVLLGIPAGYLRPWPGQICAIRSTSGPA
jgi:hypothetical protein